jgi:hypothetical protein
MPRIWHRPENAKTPAFRPIPRPADAPTRRPRGDKRRRLTKFVSRALTKNAKAEIVEFGRKNPENGVGRVPEFSSRDKINHEDTKALRRK